MIILLLGIIIGILFAIIFMIVIFHSKPVIDRKLNQLQSRIKQKGEIIEPESEELKAFLESLPNKKDEM